VPGKNKTYTPEFRVVALDRWASDADGGAGFSDDRRLAFPRPPHGPGSKPLDQYHRQMRGSIRLLTGFRPRRLLTTVPRGLTLPEGRHHANDCRGSYSGCRQQRAEVIWVAPHMTEHGPESSFTIVRLNHPIGRSLYGLYEPAVGLSEVRRRCVRPIAHAVAR
jgi:hypothetical protein